MFSGKGMVNMSLPVRIFEPRSTLERIADNFAFLNTFVKKAEECINDPVERIKNVIMATLIGMCCSPSCQKPFNPYLGETFEGTYEDGSKIYLEHIKHSPPISKFLVFTPGGSRIYGHFQQNANLRANKMTLWFKGPITYEFQDGKKLSVYYPQLIQQGIIYGTRLLKFVKRVCVIDEPNQLKGYAAFGKKIKDGRFKSSRVDTVIGEIYKYNVKKHKPLKDDLKNLYEQFKGKDLVESKSKCEGIINEAVEWDGSEYWSFEKSRAMRHKPVDHALPSDCRYREDIVWLKRNDQK